MVWPPPEPTRVTVAQPPGIRGASDGAIVLRSSPESGDPPAHLSGEAAGAEDDLEVAEEGLGRVDPVAVVELHQHRATGLAQPDVHLGRPGVRAEHALELLDLPGRGPRGVHR